jgi:hypothetical protein
VKEKSVVDRVKEGNRQQEIDLERLSKDLSMAKVQSSIPEPIVLLGLAETSPT